MILKTAMVGAALSVAITLAGCGSKPSATAEANTAAGSDDASTKSPQTTASATFNPCSVLTADEVAAVTKDKVDRTEANDHDCNYRTTFDDDGTQVSIYPTGGKDQMETIRKAYKLLGGIGSAVSGVGDVGKDVQSLITAPADGGGPALGDEVLWEPNDVLAVRKGDLFVQVTPPIVHDPSKPHGGMISDANKRIIAQKLVEGVFARLSH